MCHINWSIASSVLNVRPCEHDTIATWCNFVKQSYQTFHRNTNHSYFKLKIIKILQVDLNIRRNSYLEID